MYESPVDAFFTLNGGVVDTGRIFLLDDSGSSFDFQPTSDSELYKALGRAPQKIRLIGNGLYDRNDRLHRLLESAITYEEDAPRLPFEDDLDEIANTAPGWLEPDTPAPSMSAINAMRHFLAEVSQNSDIPASHLYPTPEGGVTAEWTINNWEASVLAGIDGSVIKIHAINVTTTEEREMTMPTMEVGSAVLFNQFWDYLISKTGIVDAD